MLYCPKTILNSQTQLTYTDSGLCSKDVSLDVLMSVVLGLP